MHVVVRRIGADDAEAMKAVRLAALGDAPAAFGSTLAAELGRSDDEWTRRALRSATGEDSALFLAWHEGDAVGIVGGFRPDGSESTIELVSMWTAPSARRAGVARQLVDAVVEWASAGGAGEVGLWVTDGNAPAMSLYESVGFEFIGDRKPLPSDPSRDEVRMQLRLSR